MQGGLFRLPLEISYKSLEHINRIKFTPREIDVVACIISGRAATKTIASFLSIESKTVEVHTRNIRLKLECNSRESIVQFIEKAGKFSVARQHYLFLSIQSAFEQKLQQISTLVIQKNLSYFIVYEKPYELFIEQLKKYFKRLGIEGTFRIKEANKSFNDSFQSINPQSITHCLFVVSPLYLEQLLMKESLKDVTLSQFLQNPEAITFISLEEESGTEMSQERNETYSIAYIHFGKSERYYLSFFDLFKRLFPNVALDKLVSEFKEQYDTLTNDPSGKTSLAITSEGKDLEQKEQVFPHLLFNFLKRRTGKLLISGILCLSVFCTFILAFKENKPDKTIPIKQVQKSKTIRSDLPLPHDNVLLKRPEIMKHIEEKLKGDQEIQTVALVGIGGAGKTTVARHYAHQQNADVIWEMNAETKESLMSSFESLAYALAKTENEKKILRELQEIKDFKESIEKILSFTKERLKTSPNWFLVYDNVEKFSDIQKYFPTDTKVWGKGKIILTTRDSNIANNSYIPHALSLGELSEKERLSLFINIMSHGNAHPLTAVQKQQAQEFLTKIPPFPLDIITTAYYLKGTQISYTQYLNYMNKQSTDFTRLQKEIMEDIGGYSKTRYGIITLSLKKLIDSHPDYKDLLLFITLLDTQIIPKYLLESYKNNIVVDSFILNLQKHSLMTSMSPIIGEQESAFSIHHTTQTIALLYLTKIYEQEKIKQSLEMIATVLENCIAEATDKERISIINILKNHSRVFLKHHKLLGEVIVGKIATQLGSTYDFLGDYSNAKKLLEQSLILHKKHYGENHLKTALVEARLGNVYNHEGSYLKAKNSLQHTYALYKNHYGENHIKTGWAAVLLGSVYRQTGEYLKARDVIKIGLEIHREHFGKNHVKTGWALINLGNVYKDIGDYSKAKQLIEHSFVITKKHFGQNHIETALITAHLGIFYSTIGDYLKARKLLKQSLPILQNYYGKKHVQTAWLLANLGVAYGNLGNVQKAKEIISSVLPLYKNHYGENHIKTAWLLLQLAKMLSLANQTSESEQYFHQSLNIFERNQHPGAYECLESLAEICLKKTSVSEKENNTLKVICEKKHAVNYLNHALKGIKGVFSKESLHIIRIEERLKTLR